MMLFIKFSAVCLLIHGVPSTHGFQSRPLPTQFFAGRRRGDEGRYRASRPSSALPVYSAGALRPRYEEDRAAHSGSKYTPRSYAARHSPEGQAWIDQSVEYYAKIMRTSRGGARALNDEEEARLARRLYQAIRQVKCGNLSRAEHIYRRTLRDVQDEDGCSNAALATTTLLLALVLQRMDDVGGARLVFHRFFRTAMRTAEKDPLHECACTGKVLGAYALFEMRFGSVRRSVEVAKRATQFDGQLAKLFDWKQFKEARQKMALASPRERRAVTPCSFVSEADLEGGEFRRRAYRVSPGDAASHVDLKSEGVGTSQAPSVVYLASKPPFGANGKSLNDVPIRLHNSCSCVKCENFTSERCPCREELERSLDYLREHGGAILCCPPPARATSLARGVPAAALPDGGLSRRPAGKDAYGVVPALLDDLGVGSVRLVSCDPSAVRRLRELGVDVRGTVPLEGRPRRRERSAAGAVAP